MTPMGTPIITARQIESTPMRNVTPKRGRFHQIQADGFCRRFEVPVKGIPPDSAHIPHHKRVVHPPILHSAYQSVLFVADVPRMAEAGSPGNMIPYTMNDTPSNTGIISSNLFKTFNHRYASLSDIGSSDIRLKNVPSLIPVHIPKGLRNRNHRICLP